MSNILITGGAGMIGSNLVKRLVHLGHRVSVIDNLWRGKLEYLHQDGVPVIDLDNDFHNIDLSIKGAADRILSTGDIDYVYHLADIVAGIGYVFTNQGDLFRKNLLINSNMIDSVRRYPVKGFIYVGTACSFPDHLQTGVDAAPLREEDQYPASPESAYGWSKLMGEYESQLLEKETGIPVGVIVFHNVYGAPCDYSEERSQVIPSLIRKAIEYPGKSFQVWGSGKQGRAFLHINDAVDALVSAIPGSFGQGPIQIGPDICVSIKDISELIVQVSQKDITIQFDLTKPEGDGGRRADFSKASRLLNWSPRVNIEAGIESLYRWIYAEMSKSPGLRNSS
jgi:GDP-D-mannose 3', 5'-epimerase